MERRQFGSYVVFTEEPKTEAGKAEYIKVAVDRLLDQLTAKIVPEWNTLELIVKEGKDFFSSNPLDWYDDEKEDHYVEFRWNMTVGIKFYSTEYPEFTEEGGKHDGHGNTDDSNEGSEEAT